MTTLEDIAKKVDGILETLKEHDKKLEQIGAKLKEHETKIRDIECTLRKHDKTLKSIEKTLQEQDRLLHDLNDRVDRLNSRFERHLRTYHSDDELPDDMFEEPCPYPNSYTEVSPTGRFMRW